MPFRVNVSRLQKSALGADLYYAHLFATADHSCVSQRDAQAAYDEIKARFPEPAFKVDIGEVTTTIRGCARQFSRKKGKGRTKP